jgi:hypothetical protein
VRGFEERSRGFLLGLILVFGAVLLVACARGPGAGPDAGTAEGDGASRTTVKEEPRYGPEAARERASPNARGTGETTVRGSEAPESAEGRATTACPAGPLSYGYTYGRSSGNRLIEGAANLPDSEPVDVTLSGEPTWVVGAPIEGDTAWVVALSDGRIEAFRFDATSHTVRPWPISPDRLAAGAPPALLVEGEKIRLLTSTDEDASTATHPIRVSLNESDAASLLIADDGALFLERDGQSTPVGAPQVVALPDARAVRSHNGRIAVLSEPTRRYDHGVIGDDIEAAEITVLEPTDGSLDVAGRVFPESGGVFELISPLWFEGQDGRELLVVTESADSVGSRIAVFNPQGELVTAGPFFGEPQRWRHLLAASPFGPNGEMEIAAVRTPHIGGVVEFYRLTAGAGELELAATQPGYASHEIYSRNLDTARGGDFDGDGAFELLVPNQERTALGAIRHEQGGARVAWTLPVGGELSTNLADAAAPGGRVSLAAGRADGVLRLWP